MPVLKHYSILLLLLILAGGCGRRTNDKGIAVGRIHAIVGDTLFLPGDSSMVAGKIDSIYNSLSRKTAGDLIEKYYLLAWHEHVTARNPLKALHYSDTLMELTEGNMGSNVYLDAVLQRGDVMTALFRYDEAFALFFRAKQLVQKRNDPCVLPSYTTRLGNLSYRRKRYREAAWFFREAVNELEKCPDTSFRHFAALQGNLDNVGVMYTRLGQLDSADYFYRRTLDYIAANEHAFPRSHTFIGVARSVVYGNMGDVAALHGDKETARRLFLLSIDNNRRKGGAPEDAAYSMLKLGGMLLDEGKKDSVGLLLVSVDSVRRDYSNPELNVRYLRLRARYEMARNNLALANKALADQVQLYDSAVIPGLANPSISVGDALEQVSRQYRLENDNRRKNDYLVVSAFAFAMLLVIIVLLWVNYRRSRKSIRRLNQLNQRISEKNGELLDTLEKLEQMRRDKRQLMHIVAHDLRSPLGSITTLAKMIRQGQIEEEGIDEVMDMIIKAGTSAQSLIKELLEERARESAGKSEPVQLHEVLEYAVGILQHRAFEKKQHIALSTLPVQLVSDREKLQRIFYNLLDNAIKFSPHGADIKVEMEEREDTCVVRIIDSGIGIPEDKRGTLLDVVASLKRTGTYGEPSYGLGLSIVSQLVKETEGRISYTSREGEGTVFVIEFNKPA